MSKSVICLLCGCLIAALPLRAVYAEDEKLPAIETAWATRLLIIDKMATIRKQMELIEWCKYESQAEKKSANFIPCKAMKDMEKETLEAAKASSELIYGALNALEHEPPSKMAKEHKAKLNKDLATLRAEFGQ